MPVRDGLAVLSLVVVADVADEFECVRRGVLGAESDWREGRRESTDTGRSS